VLLDRYKNGNGTNSAADDATATGKMEEITAKMDTNQENQERMEANQQDLLARLEARLETNREKDRENLKAMKE
jgi:hypothetical protein